ncbi:uncharacterized protein A1O5_01586 [Cladophialophora psammophila CBS 110553]|uniref:Uncharacterized protein n=1 Tax=Cladophialophora psammophila CBS 110553 TaxID=1182543 RepID=W9XC58_9EURO|nr:uncharacterized protein A1O5_01586 [Cladophialophora psammophila CBS 110553]EXJ74890.1 hypothetical protein A1O5_01586 [Cladophialophora psammophila CBS 110553]
MARMTLLPSTNSWWNAANVPGKRSQMLPHIGRIKMYEAQCLEKLDKWKGFEVGYAKGAKEQLANSETEGEKVSGGREVDGEVQVIISAVSS